ncbi:MAG: transketolase [Phycisphaerae bacterium]|nr:transketolase [Phycisphaerae bacterium]NIR63429.1 transketolase [candidate division Zixibacteria bacterium]NIP55565.1 transketolase [Phycisphaerae bacterium]NIS54796.1 transketolase [Phycisphaerae bacterium]NIU11895.1 transketolase [Phycisphaerae bacterium]
MKVSPKNQGLSELDELCIQTIRFLSMEAVQKANSGHPGMPMGMAPAAYVLWTRHMNYNPANPRWHNRDRFVLSAGHGSVLLYSLLHLTGFDLSLDELKNFRQWGSKTPGHPEYDLNCGVEVTTGPLGQGISNAVGMAIAEKYLANYFNRDGFPVIDYSIYVIASDGDLQEGIASEASSLAGHLGLDNLIVVYDDNHISIDGDTALAFTEDRAKRYKAYDWNVQEVRGDGNNMAAFEKALNNAKQEKQRPTLIKLRTHIAYGSPNMQDTAKAHGSPLGNDEITLIKERFGWDPDKSFHVPEKVLSHMRKVIDKGKYTETTWDKMFAEYAKAYPELAQQFRDAEAGKLPVNLDDILPNFETDSAVATRKASGKVLDALMPELPLVLGGSADLTPSNNTEFTGAKSFQKVARDGRYLHYGIREHAMGALMNGISVSGLARAYGGTFLVFSDYMRAAIRVAALSKYPTIFVFTHDSVGVGEDGPTHQPVEQLAALRAIPNLLVFRPADANETAQAWKFALEHRDNPTTLLLTRQNLPVIDQEKYGSATNLSKGAYVLVGADKPDVLLLASGSEVSVAMEASDKLAAEGISAQVVSMPCWKLFEKQDKEYRDSVIPPSVKVRVGIEAGVEQGWWKWLGDKGAFIGMSSFGASAPAKVCFEKFGITTENVIEAVKKVMR